MAGLGKMLKQMAKMQKKMAEIQEQLAAEELTVSGGGGAVKVTVSLQSEVKKIEIDDEFFKEDKSLVEETLVESLQEALKQAGAKSEEAMQDVASQYQVPGLPGMG